MAEQNPNRGDMDISDNKEAYQAFMSGTKVTSILVVICLVLMAIFLV